MPRRIKSLAREKVFSEDEQRVAQKAFYDHLKSYLVDECHQEVEKINKQSDFERIYFQFLCSN